MFQIFENLQDLKNFVKILNIHIFSGFIMVLMDSLATALKCINNAEKRGKRQVLLRPSSKVVIRFLKVKFSISRKKKGNNFFKNKYSSHGQGN